MKEPKVEFKNVHTFAGHDGTGLNADIWINGIFCMHVFDSACGGEFEYTENTFNNPKTKQVEANIKLLDDFIAQMPEQSTPYGKIKFDRDCYINEILAKQEDAKAEAKHEKKKRALYSHAIVIGDPAKTAYRYFDFKRPLSEIAPMIVQRQINIAKIEYCKNGEVILNDNLKALGLTV